MEYRRLKFTLHMLFREWNWKYLSKNKYVQNLIYTGSGAYRKDNRVVQNVGKPAIKFKFVIGSYLGGAPTKTPCHFNIATTGKHDRICWMAKPDGDLLIKFRHEKQWSDPFKVADFFADTANILDEEIEFLLLLYPQVAMLEEFLPGLHGVNQALRERFNG